MIKVTADTKEFDKKIRRLNENLNKVSILPEVSFREILIKGKMSEEEIDQLSNIETENNLLKVEGPPDLVVKARKIWRRFIEKTANDMIKTIVS